MKQDEKAMVEAVEKVMGTEFEGSRIIDLQQLASTLHLLQRPTLMIVIATMRAQCTKILEHEGWL